MAIDNARHVQRREVVEVLKMVLNEDKEMKENGGVLKCVQHTMQQKSEEAINNVFDQLMSHM